MSKILLIKPRFLGSEFNGITQPMGLMYIGAMLKKEGHETKIHDCAIDHKDLHILKRIISIWKPDFIGLSIIVTELEQTKKILRIIREILPCVSVTFGGPWPSANPEKAIKEFGADFVVIGEGELVFPQLIDAINKGLSTDAIPGTASMINGHVKINPGNYLTEDELNALPFPAWELLDQNLYEKNPSCATIGSRPYMTIVTSRGCPFKCAYCHRTMGKIFRKRSSQSVLDEIKELHFKHRFEEFEVVDDCFNLDRERMLAILAGIRDSIDGIKLHFPNGLRSDILEPEDMALFKQAGTVSVVFAVETSSLRLQKIIHKNLNIAKATEAINASVKAGIFSTGYFMIGFPTETYEEASATVEFAVSSPLHRALFMIPMPFTGTELADMVSNEQKRIGLNNALHDMNYFNSTYNISAMSDRDLQKIFRSAYLRFYVNPIRFLRMVINYPNIYSLPRYAVLFLMKILPKRCHTA